MNELSVVNGGQEEQPIAHSRQSESDLFGFWVFLMSDAVIFALLFATYGAMVNGTFGGPTPASEFKLGSILLETLTLLTSSFTFGMASIAMKYRSSATGRTSLPAWMGLTLLLGIIFLGLEGRDFSSMFGHGAYPNRSGFLSAFFALVPLHGLHVLVGCLWLTVMLIQICTLGCDARVEMNIKKLGVFWHFLDVVWIAIFSVVYLQGLIR